MRRRRFSCETGSPQNTGWESNSRESGQRPHFYRVSWCVVFAQIPRFSYSFQRFLGTKVGRTATSRFPVLRRVEARTTERRIVTFRGSSGSPKAGPTLSQKWRRVLMRRPCATNRLSCLEPQSCLDETSLQSAQVDLSTTIRLSSAKSKSNQQPSY